MFFFKKPDVLKKMLFERDLTISILKKELRAIKKTLDELSKKNSDLIYENHLYREETVKKDQIING
jgi:hypothetical protein